MCLTAKYIAFLSLNYPREAIYPSMLCSHDFKYESLGKLLDSLGGSLP